MCTFNVDEEFDDILGEIDVPQGPGRGCTVCCSASHHRKASPSDAGSHGVELRGIADRVIACAKSQTLYLYI